MEMLDAFRAAADVVTSCSQVLWKDPRLALNTDEAACSTVGAEIRELRTLIWDPGVIITQMGDFPDFTNIDGEALMLYPDGTVLRTVMLSMGLTCPLHFGKLPFDRHKCDISFETYMDDSTELNLVAKGGEVGDEYSGVSVYSTSRLEHTTWIVENNVDGFKHVGRNTVTKTHGLMSTRPDSLDDIDQDWDTVIGQLEFRRNPRYYVVNGLVPDLIFLGFVYLGFFVDRHSVPGRVAIVSMGLLVERTLINSIFETIPQISYNCWLTDFLAASQILIFLCAVQYGVVCFCVAKEHEARDFMLTLARHKTAVRSFKAAAPGPVFVDVDDDDGVEAPALRLTAAEAAEASRPRRLADADARARLLRSFNVFCSSRVLDHIYDGAPRDAAGRLTFAEFLELLSTIEQRFELARFERTETRYGYAAVDRFMGFDLSLRCDIAARFPAAVLLKTWIFFSVWSYYV
ncbi:polynucleotide 5'-hydroxyl-kinase [Aureococcus anophagefferens]|nr:polynucleotide 5'-hydroxyl-kinase [Aureococcus anophagefferens]